MRYGVGSGKVLILLALLSILGLAVAAEFTDLGCGGFASNGTAAIATLRNLASCEIQFRAAAKVDVDGDGRGEYGTFGEMTGAVGLRTDAAGRTRGEVLRPAILSPALANVSAEGIVTKSGYCFRIFLPARGGSAHEGKRGEAFSAPVDVDAAEDRWCAYAWPVKRDSGPHRAFTVGPSGDVLQSANDRTRYAGPEAGPAFDAAARDGEDWKPTN